MQKVKVKTLSCSRVLIAMKDAYLCKSGHTQSHKENHLRDIKIGKVCLSIEQNSNNLHIPLHDQYHSGA